MSIRHTLVTDLDIEVLSDRWTLTDSQYQLRNTSALHERKWTGKAHEALVALDLNSLANVQSLRITSATTSNLGDLFAGDLFTGTIIQVQLLQHSSGHWHELQSYLNDLLGLELEPHEVNFIKVRTRWLLYLQNPAPKLTAVVAQLLAEDLSSLDLCFSEVDLSLSEDRIDVRAISGITNATIIARPGTSTEVGLVQRQKRHLSDSEIKGLSAFLPASDLGKLRSSTTNLKSHS